MHSRWIPSLLTISQALLAGALPAPRPFGQLDSPADSKCSGAEGPSHTPLLTSRTIPVGVDASLHTFGPPFETSYPAGKNPFAGPGPYPPFVPNFNIRPTQFASVTQTSPTPPTEVPTTSSLDQASGGATEQHSKRYTSEITYVDPHLSMQTVTLTDLPSSQEPTITSASQNFPDTTGVSALMLLYGTYLILL
jgi:hypothetical protein